MKSEKFPSLIRATQADQSAIQNMARFYVYDMSRYCGEESGWEIPEDGLYECFDLSQYFQEKNRFPFLIRFEQELAGFVLVNKIGTSTDVDWNIGEFFVLAKFQGKGIGKTIAFEIFDLFRGTWEVAQMPKNSPAIQFWKKVVAEYSAGQFTESLQVIQEPKPHPMIVLKFISKSGSSEI
jgi:predicted acetyltransferase